MNKTELHQNYSKACNDYIKFFAAKHNFNNYYWISNEPGTVACFNEYYFAGMEVIVDDINLDAPKKEFEKWHNYSTELRILGAETTPSYRNWLRGCPRKSEEEIQDLKKSNAKIEALKKDLLEQLNTEPAANKLQEILNKVCTAAGISEDKIRLKTRKQEIVMARQAFFYFARETTGFSHETLGDFMGGFNHATISHAIKSVSNLLESKDRMMTGLVRKIQNSINY